jgi:hypothetical protein
VEGDEGRHFCFLLSAFPHPPFSFPKNVKEPLPVLSNTHFYGNIKRAVSDAETIDKTWEK